MSDDSKPTRDELHDGSRTFVRPAGLPLPVTITTVHQAFARRLTKYNDTQTRMGLPVPALQDPRDISAQIQALASHLACHGARMDTVEALGAQVTALALAVTRVEDSRIELGDAA